MSPSTSGDATNSRREDRPSKKFKPYAPPFTYVLFSPSKCFFALTFPLIIFRIKTLETYLSETNNLNRDPKALVTFVVGPEGHTTEFLIHKEVACHHSKVLEAAFRSQFVEGSTQTYRLADTTEGAFKFMMQWMYSQKLNLLHHDPNHKVDINAHGKDGNQDSNLVSAPSPNPDVRR